MDAFGHLNGGPGNHLLSSQVQCVNAGAEVRDRIG